MNPRVAVVILNWNGRSFLERFLKSVVNTAYPNLQVVVGDNASTDESLAFVRTTFPEVLIIENDKNYGFAEGYNRVLNQVSADYFVLLNSDVAVPENWISPVIDMMEADNRIAAAQPKIKWYNDQRKFEYAGAAGGFLDCYGFPFCRGRMFDINEIDSGQYNDACEIFWASGAALFVKRSCWLEVGGLDPGLFAHMEEIDVCWRLKNLGYKVVYCPQSEVYHVGGGTLNSDNPFKTYLNFRNNLYILQKNLPLKEAYIMIFLRFWIDLIAWLHFIATGKFRHAVAVSKAHVSFFKNIRTNSRKRAGHQFSFLSLTGVYKHSVVWAFFVRKISRFNQLKDLVVTRLKATQ